MEIRVMTIDDYDMVYQLWLNTPGMGLNHIDDSKKGIHKYLLRNPHTSFVAIENNQIIGVIMSGHDGRRGFIYHLSVATHQRHKGIGSTLLQSAMDALEYEGIHKVALVTFADNQVGNQFWEKNGFIIRDDLFYRNKAIHPLKVIKP
jgi:ribosomal protein S18 acetylase RimI-like enzyme